MPKPVQHLPTIEEDLNRLETGLRRLKVEYQRFFAGGRKREPLELRWQVDKIVKRYAEARIRKYHHRFRFNTLVGHYNLYAELWGKTLRAQEEGTRRRALSQEKARARDTLVARCRIGEGEPDRKSLKLLYDRFVEAQTRHGQEKTNLSFGKFVRGISTQAGNLRQSAGCAEIELRLVVRDSKVQLEARPCR